MSSKITTEERKQLLKWLEHHVTAADMHAKVADGIAKRLRITKRTLYLCTPSGWYPRSLTKYTAAARSRMNWFMTHDENGNLLPE